VAGRHYDVIVLGGGTIGTAAAWELGKRGIRTLVIEQFGHVHDRGAHGGQTRIYRQAYAESPDYVPLVREAGRLWRELESETGEVVYVACGGLELAATGCSHASDARHSAEEHSIPFEWLTPEEGRARWPHVAIPDGWDVLFSPEAGFVLTEPALRGMMAGAVERGVELHQGERAIGWESDGAGVRVSTDRGEYAADRLIVAAGAWADRMLADLDLPLRVLRKTLWWFSVNDPNRFTPERFPVFIADEGEQSVYGFPVIDQTGLKAANHTGGEPFDPNDADRSTRPGEEMVVQQTVRRLFPGVGGQVTQSTVCLYTMTPDGHFVMDRHPEHPNVVVAAGFSGHGFKFAPAAGKHLVSLALQPDSRPIRILAVDRLLSGAPA
jgi:monomeric sarcosine oxidase